MIDLYIIWMKLIKKNNALQNQGNLISFIGHPHLEIESEEDVPFSIWLQASSGLLFSLQYRDRQNPKKENTYLFLFEEEHIPLQPWITELT